jgi:AcrR family transcriptional regulator
MSPSTRPRSTRDRPAKAPLSVDAIVDAALAILRSEGLEALSMRRVAAALDTGAGSLYVYVSGRDALLEALFDRVIGGVALESPDPSRWRDQVHALLEGMRTALVAHPGMAATTMVDPPGTEVAMRLLEHLLGLLLAGGLEPQAAAWTADMLAAQVTFAAIESDLRRRDTGTLVDEVTANFARLPAEQFPLITTYATQLVSGGVEERFHFAIDVVIDGVLARGLS